MLSSSLLKNFCMGDSLKDFLQKKVPLPSKNHSSLFPSRSSSLQSKFKTQHQTLCFSSEQPLTEQLEKAYAVFGVQIQNEKYHEQGICLSTKFTHPSIPSAECYVLFFDIIHAYQICPSYIQCKMAITKDILLSLGFLSVSFVHITEEATVILPSWRERDVQTLLSDGQCWLSLVETYKDVWSLDPPSNMFLMPNLACHAADEYSSIRETLAWKCKEVSLLYYVGSATRKRLYDQGITRVDHPHLKETLRTFRHISSQTYQIQCKMIDNMFSEVKLQPPIWSSTNFYQKYIYVDIETSLEEEKTVVNLIGCVYVDGLRWKYISFASRDQSCIETFREFAEEHKDCTFVHYTAADKIVFTETMMTLDLHVLVPNAYLVREDMQALGLHNFRLKTLYKQITKRCGFVHLYDDCMIKNGLEALQECNLFRRGEYACMISVIRYNRVDCIALAALHMFLQATFDASFKDMLTKS